MNEVTVALFVAIIALVGSVVAGIATTHSSRLNHFIDSLQNQINIQAENIATLNKQIAELQSSHERKAVLIRLMADFIDAHEAYEKANGLKPLARPQEIN